MGFNTSYILNDKLSVKSLNEIGTKSVYANRSGALVANKEETVIDINEPVIIDYLSFSTNSQSFGAIRILPRVNGALTSISDIKSDGTGVSSFNPGSIKDNVISFFDIAEYDVTNLKYKFFKEGLYFPEGVMITVKNFNSTDTINMAALVLGRKVL